MTPHAALATLGTPKTRVAVRRRRSKRAMHGAAVMFPAPVDPSGVMVS
jgi:hypothetical protein